MSYDKNITRLRVSVAVLAASFGMLAQAQQRPDSGTIIEQQRDRLRTPGPERDVVPKAPAVRPAMPASATLKVNVTAFRVSGNTVIKEDALLAALAGSVGKTLDFDGLNDAATVVQRLYRERGYFLAVAFLPAQQIQNGVVEISVLEGSVGKVTLDVPPKVRMHPSLPRGILDAYIKPGALITETGLERPLLLINDLAGVNVASALGPSKDKVGAADVTVKLQEDAKIVTGYVDMDNSGNRFTGQNRAGVSINFNDLAGYGDLFSVRGFASDERMNFGRFAYVIPVGYWGTRVGLSYTAFDYRLAQEFTNLSAHGEGQVSTVYALHPFLRTRNANFLMQAAYETKLLQDYVDSVKSYEKRAIKTGKLGAIGDFRDGMLGGGFNSYSLNYTAGKLFLGPDVVLKADQTTGTGLFTDGNFAKTNAEYKRLQRITGDLNVLLSYSGQYASKNLASAEKFTLGGPNGVRAYPTGEATGDSGYLATAELRYIVPKFKVFQGDVTVAAFYDLGNVQTTERALLTNMSNMRGLAGYGLGLDLGREGHFLVKTSFAWRAEDQAPSSDTSRRIPRVWAQAIKWF